MQLRLLSIFLLLFLFTGLAAQQNLSTLGCGTTERSPWLDKYQRGEINPLTKALELQYVPLQLTIVGDDGGGGYADPLTIIESFRLLNEDFEKIGVQFYLDGDIAYVNSTIYYDHDFETGRDLITNFSRKDVFNSFLVGSPAGNCGYYSGNGDAVVLSNNCITNGDRTWSHEVGHYFGLPHTFYGWESVGEISKVEAFDKPAPETLIFGNETVQVEKVDRSNCAEAADGFCDTSPDYLPQRWACATGGIYPDSLLDPDSTRFVVPANNIMSYSFDGCVEDFSGEQIAAMVTNLGGRLGLADRTTPTFTAATADDLQLLSPEDRGSVPYSDAVTLSWNSVPNADFYVVQLNINANFNGNVFNSFITSDTSAIVRDILTPNRQYYWRVRPVNRYDVSGAFGEVFRFRNGAFTTATVDRQLDAALQLSPNPVRSTDLLLSLTGIDGQRAAYQVFDPSGRMIVERRGLNLVAGSLSTRVPTQQLSAGVYFLRLSIDGRTVSRRFVVTP